jgi:type II secretory pathway component PulC
MPTLTLALSSNPLRQLFLSVLLCAGLGGVLIAELYAAPATERTPTSTASTAAASLPEISNRFTLPPLASFAEIVERPLFSSSRRPLASETPQRVDQPLSASLAGIVISNSSRSIIVSHGDPPVVTRLKEGDDLDGWSVGTIEPNRVLFRRGGDEQQLKLHDAPGQGAAEASPKPEPTTKPRR